MLGDLAKDKITGYTGIIVAITQWITGCVRITMLALELKDGGKPTESHTTYESMVDVIESNAIPSANRPKETAPQAMSSEELEIAQIEARLAELKSKGKRGGPRPEPTPLPGPA